MSSAFGGLDVASEKSVVADIVRAAAPAMDGDRIE
jgi:hypothetical protein